MAEERVNQELMKKANITLASTKRDDPTKIIQVKILAKGAGSFKTLNRRFRIMDDDKSHKLNFDEFKYGLMDFKIVLSDAEFRQAFNEFDKDDSGQIDMDEFLMALTPPMSKGREDIIRKCFTMMDKTGDGQITVDDLVDRYNASKHAKFISGEWTQTRVFQEFLKTFEAEGNIDGIVTWDDFRSYYACLSASIDEDAYFALMMRNSWKHLDK